MRTKTFIAAAAFAVVALFSGINAYNNSSEVKLSDLALANVEALANDGEIGPGGVVIKTCYALFDDKQPDTAIYMSCDPNDDPSVYYECGAVSIYKPQALALNYVEYANNR